jgi:predicted lipid-binding transport protein (Tim44 family)
VTNSSAQTTDTDVPAAETNNKTPTETPTSAGILLLLLLLAGVTIFYFLKIQRPSLPNFSGVTGRDPSIDNLPNRRSSTRRNMSIDSVTSDDKAAFQQLLIDVQRAWSKQDLTELRQFVTPEMLNYFSAALADNTSQDIQNHVDDVVLLRAEVLEAWTEQTTRYVTAGLRWSARDYNLSLKKQRGEPGYVVAGSEETPTESREVWTFMESPDGKWLLSAIQQ